MKRVLRSISDPKKVTAIAIVAYFICIDIAVILMFEESNWVTRWFTPSVMLFGAIIALWSAWFGIKRIELAALWPVSLGLVSGFIIELDNLIPWADHFVPYITGLSLFSLLLVWLRVDFLVSKRGG